MLSIRIPDPVSDQSLQVPTCLEFNSANLYPANGDSGAQTLLDNSMVKLQQTQGVGSLPDLVLQPYSDLAQFMEAGKTYSFQLEPEFTYSGDTYQMENRFDFTVTLEQATDTISC